MVGQQNYTLPIYFDNNATTAMDEEVLAEINNVAKMPLNSSSSHYFGQLANKINENCRYQIKKLLNAHNYQIFFTSGATEANNTIINGIIQQLNLQNIIISAIEHDAVYNYCHNIISDNKLLELDLVNVDNMCNIDFLDLEEKLIKISNKNKPFLLSIMLANNETGTIQDIKNIAKMAHRYHGIVHSDIAQAIGKIKVDIEDLNIDIATISGHKFHGPQGIGAIIIRKHIDFKPLFYGGGQEQFKRAGTVNILSTSGLAIACKIAHKNIEKHNEISKIRDYFEENLMKIYQKEVMIFAKNSNRLPNTSYFGIRNCDNQTLLIYLDMNGICASAGSACSSGSLKKSRILNAMKIDTEFSNSAIRISFNRHNNKEEIDYLLKIINQFINK